MATVLTPLKPETYYFDGEEEYGHNLHSLDMVFGGPLTWFLIFGRYDNRIAFSHARTWVDA